MVCFYIVCFLSVHSFTRLFLFSIFLSFILPILWFSCTTLFNFGDKRLDFTLSPLQFRQKPLAICQFRRLVWAKVLRAFASFSDSGRMLTARRSCFSVSRNHVSLRHQTARGRVRFSVFHFYCHVYACDYRRGLDWWLDSLTTYTANAHNSQTITATTKSFPAGCIFTIRSLATVLTMEILQLLALKSSLHSLPYRTQLSTT
jgi:hypothetical protein